MRLSRRAFIAGAGACSLKGCASVPDLRGIGALTADAYFPIQPVSSQPESFNTIGFVDPSSIQMRQMPYYGRELPGTMIVNFQGFKLYHVNYDATATEYPIALGRVGINADYNNLYVARKAANPTWTPTPNMRAVRPSLPRQIPGGSPNNPLGSHAVYFYDARTGQDTLIRAHGTRYADRDTIGTSASSGCFRMLNEHAEHLYTIVRIGSGPSTSPIGKSRLRAHRASLFVPGIAYDGARFMRSADIATQMAIENSLPRPRPTFPAF
jgi:hypothetical protein